MINTDERCINCKHYEPSRTAPTKHTTGYCANTWRINQTNKRAVYEYSWCSEWRPANVAPIETFEPDEEETDMAEYTDGTIAAQQVMTFESGLDDIAIRALCEVRDALDECRMSDALELANAVERGVVTDAPLARYRGRLEGLTIARTLVLNAIKEAQTDE